MANFLDVLCVHLAPNNDCSCFNIDSWAWLLSYYSKKMNTRPKTKYCKPEFLCDQFCPSLPPNIIDVDQSHLCWALELNEQCTMNNELYAA